MSESIPATDAEGYVRSSSKNPKDLVNFMEFLDRHRIDKNRKTFVLYSGLKAFVGPFSDAIEYLKKHIAIQSGTYEVIVPTKPLLKIREEDTKPVLDESNFYEWIISINDDINARELMLRATENMIENISGRYQDVVRDALSDALFKLMYGTARQHCTVEQFRDALESAMNSLNDECPQEVSNDQPVIPQETSKVAQPKITINNMREICGKYSIDVESMYKFFEIQRKESGRDFSIVDLLIKVNKKMCAEHEMVKGLLHSINIVCSAYREKPPFKIYDLDKVFEEAFNEL